MQNKYIKFLIIALAMAIIVPQIALAAWWNPMSWGWLNSIFHFQQEIQKPEPVACPAIAKLCPDGSSVSPQGPKCEFPACPIASNQPFVGGDKDAHGCIGSAGYTWCEAKQKCLRSWEEDCNILSDVYPLFSNATWSSPITTKLDTSNESNVPVQEIKGTGQISDNTQSQDFSNYYKNKLTAAGWTEDVTMAANGNVGGEVAYRKDNNLIVLNYQLTPGKITSGANEPMQWTCPCNMNYKIFTGQTTCQTLYGFDNTSDNPCQLKNFCGAYMYYGLHIFKNQNECFNGWSQASGRGQQISQELKGCLIMGEKVSHINNCTAGQCWDELNKRCTNITIIK